MEEKKKNQKLLVEEMGRHFDKEGMQPIAARIFALLTVSDQEEMTFDQIVEELMISKSSASNALKLLELRELIEYVTYPGDRKRYFRVRTKEVFSMIRDFEYKLSYMLGLNRKIIQLKEDKGSRVASFLEDINDMIVYFQENLDKFKQGYSKEK
jgi:DNA-binding transcriptional regulator GbsR (MarR family)